MKQIVLKQHHINPTSQNYLEDYLVNIGVREDQVKYFINTDRYTPTWDGILGDNPFDLPNIEEAAKVYIAALNKGLKIFVQVDSDTDGFTSAAILYNYTKKFYPNADISYRLHEGKQHGIIPSTVPEGTNVVVIPDAGSMQTEELTELSNQGKTVIVLDHHEYDQSTNIPNVYIVNSQSTNFSNHGLSGAGVVFMFVKVLDKLLGHNYSNYYCDLAALGIISDVMDSRILGNHLIINEGLHNIRNKMFRELLLKQSFKISEPANPTKIDIAFYITPLINGLIRSGSQEEKETFFKAMLEQDNTETFESTSRGNLRVETIWQMAARIAGNAKSRQDNAKKKMIEFLKNKIETEGLNEHKILAVPLNQKDSEKVNPNIVGLAAMDIAKYYNRPTIITRYTLGEDNSVHYSGSGRSNHYIDLPSLKEFLESTGQCDFVEGHANAFGVSVPASNYAALVTIADEKLKDINYDDNIIEVDYYFRGIVNSALLSAFATAKYLWGNSIDEPKFAFDVDIKCDEFATLGKEGATLKFKKGNIDFIMFNATEVIKELQSRPVSSVTIIGRAATNEWNGRVTTQVVIEDIVVQEQRVSILQGLI